MVVPRAIATGIERPKGASEHKFDCNALQMLQLGLTRRPWFGAFAAVTLISTNSSRLGNGFVFSHAQ